ncbi:hypothetical protein LINPERHAP2_LOCUS24927 [Linum perenne]
MQVLGNAKVKPTNEASDERYNNISSSLVIHSEESILNMASVYFVILTKAKESSSNPILEAGLGYG